MFGNLQSAVFPQERAIARTQFNLLRQSIDDIYDKWLPYETVEGTMYTSDPLFPAYISDVQLVCVMDQQIAQIAKHYSFPCWQVLLFSDEYEDAIECSLRDQAVERSISNSIEGSLSPWNHPGQMTDEEELHDRTLHSH